MHSITFDGTNSRAFCKLFVDGSNTFNAPERDIESIPIPGRNGELTIDNGRYKNMKVTYSAWIAENFNENAEKARNWLCRKTGYKILTDDYHPEEFRKARFVSGLNFSTIAGHEAGVTNLVFDCMPQRFLNSGLTPVSVVNGGQIENPSKMESLPLYELTIVGSGTSQLRLTRTGGGYSYVTIKIPAGETFPFVMYLDAELQRAYDGNNVSKDAYVTGTIPYIPGKVSSSSITVSYNTSVISGVTITPNWWIL